MANILYGVNGEGAGHSTRAREVLTHLKSKGHTIHVASFDRGLRNLGDAFDVTEIYGFRFAYVNNRMRYKRTLARNLISAPQAAKSISQLKKLTSEWQTQVVITDFEPLTCHVAHRMRLPVISIDNQHSMTNLKVSYAKQDRRDAAAAKILTKMMTPRADAYLVTSFFDAPVSKKKTFLVPPILREQILQAKPWRGEHVLVYVTSPAPDLTKLLSSVRCRFIAYGFGREGEEGNILYKKPSMEGFMQDLLGAKALVANAGFSLVTEALHLGKPYLAVPVQHQFEQVFNAYWLGKTGYGAYWPELNKERVDSFLFNLPVYEEKLAEYPRHGNHALFEKLDTLIEEFTKPGRARGRHSES